jgi:hypothetical protein
MMLELDPCTWEWLLMGLETMAEEAAREDRREAADRYRALTQSLNNLGKTVLSGRIDGYWIRAKIRDEERIVVIKLAETAEGP